MCIRLHIWYQLIAFGQPNIMVLFNLTNPADAREREASALHIRFVIKDDILRLAFATREISRICENNQEARRIYGDAIAEGLSHRMYDLESAPRVTDLPAGRPAPIDHENSFKLNLPDDHQLVFKPNHTKCPFDNTGKVDWSKVSKIQIIRIERNNA